MVGRKGDNEMKENDNKLALTERMAVNFPELTKTVNPLTERKKMRR